MNKKFNARNFSAVELQHMREHGSGALRPGVKCESCSLDGRNRSLFRVNALDEFPGRFLCGYCGGRPQPVEEKELSPVGQP